MKRRTILKRIGTATAVAAAGAGSAAADHDSGKVTGVGMKDDPVDGCFPKDCTECLMLEPCRDCSDWCT